MAVQRYMIDLSALYAKLQKYFLIARHVSYNAAFSISFPLTISLHVIKFQDDVEPFLALTG